MTENYAKSLEITTTYKIKGKEFIVKPVFKNDKKETLGEILIKLMKLELEFA